MGPDGRGLWCDRCFHAPPQGRRQLRLTPASIGDDAADLMIGGVTHLGRPRRHAFDQQLVPPAPYRRDPRARRQCLIHVDAGYLTLGVHLVQHHLSLNVIFREPLTSSLLD